MAYGGRHALPSVRSHQHTEVTGMARLKCDPSRLPKPKLPPTRTVRVIHEENLVPDEMAYFPVAPMVKEKARDAPYSDDEIDMILELHEEGLTPTAIGKKLKRNPGAIHMKLKQMERRRNEVYGH